MLEEDGLEEDAEENDTFIPADLLQFQTGADILNGIGLTLNEEKTRICRAWDESFNFLGYTFGKLYSQGGRAYLGQRPSHKSVLKYRDTVRQLTAPDQTSKSVRTVAEAVSYTHLTLPTKRIV